MAGDTLFVQGASGPAEVTGGVSKLSAKMISDGPATVSGCAAPAVVEVVTYEAQMLSKNSAQIFTRPKMVHSEK